MIVKLRVDNIDADLVKNFNWCIINEVNNTNEIIGDIDETKLDDVKEYLVSKYIEQKVSESNAAATK